MESTNLINTNIIFKSNVIEFNKSILFFINKKYLIILFFCVFCIITYFTKKNSSSNKIDRNLNGRLKILSEGKYYIEKCLKSLFQEKNFQKVLKPLISVIIPIYNCEETISYSINSIQNQNLSEIEIILINDFSKDNSTKIISSFMEKDKRIKLINNNKNMGTLYSRCIGTLISKGNYIFALDNDDMFFNDDVFDYVYKKAIEENFDIIGFKTICVNDYYDKIESMKEDYFSNRTNNLIIHQPKLGIHPIFRIKGYNKHEV